MAFGSQNYRSISAFLFPNRLTRFAANAIFKGAAAKKVNPADRGASSLGFQDKPFVQKSIVIMPDNLLPSW